MTGTIELCADRETWKKRQLDSTSRDPAQRTKAVGNSGNFQLSGPHRLSHGADSRSSPRPVCLSLQPHVALPCSVSKGQSGRPSKGSDSVGRRHEAWRLCSVVSLVWGGAKTPGQMMRCKRQGKKMEVALHRDYCKLQVPYRAVEPKIGGWVCNVALPRLRYACSNCAYRQLGLVNFNPRMGQNSSLPPGCTVGCRVPPRQNGSLHLSCKMEVRKRPWEWRSFRPACLVCIRVVGRGCTGQAAMSCGAGGLDCCG